MIPEERAHERLWTISLDRAGLVHMDVAIPAVTKAAMAATLRAIADGLESGDLVRIDSGRHDHVTDERQTET